MAPGTTSNQDGRNFEHYGQTSIQISDLPDEFISGDEGFRIRWCRGFLSRSLGVNSLPNDFTCHEQLRIDADGVVHLDMFAVDYHDHSQLGRPLRYHRRHPDFVRDNPNTLKYIGGRGLLRRLERSGGIDRVYRPSYRRKTLPIRLPPIPWCSAEQQPAEAQQPQKGIPPGPAEQRQSPQESARRDSNPIVLEACRVMRSVAVMSDTDQCFACLGCDLSDCNADGYFSTTCEPNCVSWCGQ